MAILEVAGQQANTFSTSSVDSLALAFPNPVTSGNLLIVTGAGWKATAYTDFVVTDTLGTSYTTVLGTAVAWSGGNGLNFIAYGLAPSAGANTVTVNPAGGNGTLVFAVDEFTGVHGTPLDVNGGNTNSTGTTLTDGITTGVDGALAVGQFICNASVPGPVIQGGFSSLYLKTANEGHPGGAAFKICGAAGAQTFGWTVSTSRSFCAMTLSFAPVTAAGQSVDLSGPTLMADVVFSILPAFTAPLGLVTDTSVLFDVVPAVDLGQSIWTETGTAADGVLTVADQPWTRLAGGTRWQISSNQLAFIGNGFGAELARCDTPLTRESYRVNVPFDGWQLNTANDISLGVIVRKDGTATLTCYAIYMTRTPTAEGLRIARYLNGTVTVLHTLEMALVEGQPMEVLVLALEPPTTRLVVRIGGIPVADLTDDLIPSGRYVGVLGYLQGVFIPAAVLRLGTMTASALGQRIPPHLLGLAPLTGAY